MLGSWWFATGRSLSSLSLTCHGMNSRGMHSLQQLLTGGKTQLTWCRRCVSRDPTVAAPVRSRLPVCPATSVGSPQLFSGPTRRAFSLSSWLTAQAKPGSLRGGASRQKLPFEVDINVAKDVILYTHTNQRFFRMLSIFGAAQLVFWAQLAFFSYTSLGAIDSQSSPTINKESFWGKVVVLQTQYKSRIAGVCAAVGGAVLFFTVLYPRRTIRQLVLLRGGRDLDVTTYGWWGRARRFTVPVDHLSVQAARASSASQVSLKLKGHRFFYLMDKRDGRFHDTNLFDYAVGLKRDLKK